MKLITGASGGIGEALAHEFADRKHALLLVARNEKKLQALCEELRNKNHVMADYVVADLAQSGGPFVVFDKVKKKNLTVEVLVNNAGIGSSGEFAMNDLQSELAMLQLNNSSMVALCRLFLPEMIRNGRGSIINVGSMASFFPSPYMAVYAASKAFVKSFTQALIEENKPHNIHVMFAAPGLTTTNFMKTSANDNEWGRTLTEGAPTQTPDEVAAEIVQAWEQKKTFHVSGSRNRITARIASLIPGSFIAKTFAERKRKAVKK